MASVVAARRAVQQVLAGVSAANYNVGHAGFWGRGMSQLVKSNGKRAFLVDTLALVRTLESQGVPSKQAEAITAAITEVLNDSLENVAQSYVSKGEMQKSEMIQEANLSKFKSEVKSSQEHNFSLLQREIEKVRSDIEKYRSELRYEIDKVTAGQRLDLNLERGISFGKMGLSSLPTPSEGVFSVILVNTALSIAIFKETLRSILQIIGIRLDPAFSESDDDIPSGTIFMEPLPPYAEDIRDRISSVVFESIGCSHDTECAVCLTRFERESEVSRLSCGHFFHKPCFDKWLDYWHSTCPLCRSSLMSEDECW